MHKITSIILALLLIATPLSVLSVSGSAEPTTVAPLGGGSFGGGDGSPGNPWIIEDVWDLQEMATNWADHYVLGNDIDASATIGWNGGQGFVPVGTGVTPFIGSLDGRGHSISGLFINRPSLENVGLFGRISSSFVANLTLEGVDISGDTFVGGLVGLMLNSRISNVSVSGSVRSARDVVGGLVGYVWQSLNRVDNCSSMGSVVCGADQAGGLIGYHSDGDIADSWSSSSVSGRHHLGGLVGMNNAGKIRRSYASGDVTGSGSYIGGFTSILSSDSITDCYSWGNVTGIDSVGGFLAGVWSASCTVARCYSAGSVSSPGSFVGGFVADSIGTISDSYWDVTTSGLMASAGGTGKTTAEMKTQATFDPPWDFANVWWMKEGITYPLLISLNAQPVRNVDLDRYYSSIQDAIDDVETLDGHTITADAGEYHEKVNFQGKSIHLIGAGSGNTTIIGDGTGVVVSMSHLNGARLNGFTISGGGNDSWTDAGLLMDTTHNCTIDDVNVSGGSMDVYMSWTHNNTIANSTFSDNQWGDQSGDGIYMYNSSRNLIFNCTIEGNQEHGVNMLMGDSNTILGGNINDNWVGIRITESHSNAINGLVMSGNSQAIVLSETEGSVVSNNLIQNNSGAIQLRDSGNATLANNMMLMNGIYINGEDLHHWNTHTIGTDNQVNGRDVIYLKNQTGLTVPANAGQVILANCSHIIVENQDVSNSTTGIALGFSANCTVANNTANHNVESIFIYYSHHNIIENNTASFNEIGGYDEMGVGILLHTSFENQVVNNTVNSNDIAGIYLFGAFNLAQGNVARNNSAGIVAVYANVIIENTVSDSRIKWHGQIWSDEISDGTGIYIWGFSNQIISNTVTGCQAHGIHLYGAISGWGQNVITGNQISLNGNGTFINGSADNILHHNRFVSNGVQAFDDSASTWHEDATLEGNFWSDYRGLYPNALTNDGKTWNTPYAIDGGAQDLHPLTGLTVTSIRIVDTPLTGQTAITDSQAGAGFSITGYAAAFNGSEYIGDIALTWSVQNFNGATAWISANGNTSTFNVGSTTGYAHWRATYNSGSGVILTYTVNMTCDPVPPTANAGPDQSVGQNVQVTFDGSGSSDTSGIANYTWNFTYNGTALLLYGVSPTYSFWTTGIYVVTLTVTDALGNHAADTMTVTVNDVINPVANAGPDQTVNAGTVVTFDGSASTDNVGIDNYTWAFTFDGAVRTLYGVSPTFNFTIAGNYTVTLTVRDAAGNTATDTMAVNVAAILPPADTTSPVANAGPDQTVSVGTIVIFTGAGSADNVGVTNYTWTFTFGGTARVLYGVSPTFNFTIAGNYTVTLTVRDAAGNTGTDTMAVTVSPIPPANQPPVASAGPDQIVTAGTLVTFDGSGSTDDHGITNYTWTFTYNGTTVTLWGMNPTFTFWVAGNYTARCTVTDADGDTGFDDVLITITPAQVPEEPVDDSPGSYLWIILILILAIVGGILGYWLISKRGKEHPENEPEEPVESVADNPITGIGIPIKHGPNKPSGKRETGQDQDSDEETPTESGERASGGGKSDVKLIVPVPMDKGLRHGGSQPDEPSLGEISSEASNPVPGIGIVIKHGPNKPSGKREAGDDRDMDNDGVPTDPDERKSSSGKVNVDHNPGVSEE